MNTPAVPALPPPPMTPRACCVDPEATEENYLSCYLWKFNNSLYRFFPWIFFDMRYGYFLLPYDRTTDWGEFKFDVTNFKINIEGTEHYKAWYTEGY